MLASPSKVSFAGAGKPHRNGSQDLSRSSLRRRETSPSDNTPLEQIRVVIADDHPVARQGLSAILGSLDDVKVVAEAADGEEACRFYYQYSPDVLIVDLRMPKKDGLQVVDELMSARPPKPRIIVITTYEDEEDIRRAVKAGAKGYLVKVADCEQIEATIRAVAAGGSLFPTSISLKLVEAVARPELSKRELDVLHFIATGKSNKEIGAVLYISELTVKGHVRSILEKLGAKGRSEAIAIAVRRGLIQTQG
ncbi:MAG: response regulator transcription factor [Verrucomicrobia bacterium]|nr:response regulator transcription factor [Verrucomicrobiota bacterium]